MEPFDTEAELAELACEDFSAFGLAWRPMLWGERDALSLAYVRPNRLGRRSR